MSYTKAEIYNLALGALLLQRQTIDPATDASNEVKVLNTHYTSAFEEVLSDLDLDSTSSDETLALIESNPTDNWGYSYQYPTNCLLLRRIKSTSLKDNKTTKIALQVRMKGGVKVIFTNEISAVGEIIDADTPLSTLSSGMGLAIAYRLAILAAPLIVGKGSRLLREEVQGKYIVAKAEAQERDKRENFNFDDDEVDSEFVQARLE